MRLSKISPFLMLVLLLAGLVVAPAAAQDNILRIVTNFDVRTVDPHIAYEFDTWPATSLFHVGLVKLDDNTDPIPALAEAWTISDDGLVYTFTLREGIKFSNGRDITAEDVKYSFERLLNPETASPTAYMFEAITGTAAFQNGEAEEVTGIRVVDPRTVEFTFDFPVWTIMKRFALPPGMIIPREGVEATDNFGRNPLGAGPFVLDSWESGVRMVGSRNPNYFEAGQPYVDGFELSIGVEPSVGILRIENGEADVSLDFVPNADFPRINTDTVLAERLLPLAAFPNIDYVIFNPNIEPFNDVRVRRALSIAIDRQRLGQISNGRAVPAEGPIPPVSPGNNADLEPIAYDPDGARALLAEAGYPDGFSTELLSTTDPQQISFAQAVIADWAAVGVQAELISIDGAQFIDTVVNQPDQVVTVITEWYMDYIDPSNIYEPLLACGGSYNWGRYCNEEMDAFFTEANLLPPGDERWAAFAQLEAMLVEDQPNAFLQHRNNYYFVSDRLTIESDPAVLLRFASATVQ
jgi:ABC-type transport system substrate-binding protein